MDSDSNDVLENLRIELEQSINASRQFDIRCVFGIAIGERCVKY